MDQPTSKPQPAQIVLLTSLAMIAFAANSILCRLALGSDLIDAASFTTVRLVSGSLCLLAIVLVRNPHWRPQPPKWSPVLTLFGYMACFSFAYQGLSAGIGALLLFGCVQLTMVSAAVYKGERLPARAWIGLLLALGGLVYLVLPGLEAPDPISSVLMAIAGIAWGLYSLNGIQGGDPTSATANNFLYAMPIAIGISLLASHNLSISWRGFYLAVASGALASGVGYALWYRVLTHIKASSAAIVQLSVPALATMGGIALLAEPASLRLALATTLTIGGIALFLTQTKQS